MPLNCGIRVNIPFRARHILPIIGANPLPKYEG
jgi:hypothetical protein